MAERFTTLARALAVSVVLAGFLLPAEAAQPKQTTPELDAERDPLLAAIVQGKDLEANIQRFKSLVARRDALIPTSMSAKRALRARQEARIAWDEEWRKTADSEVSWRCRLPAEPLSPPPSNGYWPGDWGRVVRKEQVTLEPGNALAEPEVLTLYEVKGQRRSYKFKADGFGVFRRSSFTAEKGDLVLVCDGGTTTAEALPASWQQGFQQSGFAVRLREVPRIVKKAKWSPLHITDNDLFWAVRDVRWKFEPGRFVLAVITIERDLGGGRYVVGLIQNEELLIEVPAGLPNRQHLVEGQRVWAIMGNPRFDKELKKLVLQVEDVEPRYIDEVSLDE